MDTKQPGMLKQHLDARQDTQPHSPSEGNAHFALRRRAID